MFDANRLRLVRALLSAGIVLFAVAQIVSVGAGALLPDLPPTNPFAEYADLTPGAPIESVSQLHCEHNYSPPSGYTAFTYCLYIPDHESIDWVSITARDGIIQRVTFGVRLRYGDLVAVFGQADEKRQYPTIASFEWEGIYASGSVRRWARVSMLTPVNRVVFRLSDGV